MELGLSLGDPSKQVPFGGRFMEKAREVITNKGSLGFCMALSISSPNPNPRLEDLAQEKEEQGDKHMNTTSTSTTTHHTTTTTIQGNKRSSSSSLIVIDSQHHRDDDKIFSSNSSIDPVVLPLQLDLLPNTPVPRNHHSLSRPSQYNGISDRVGRGRGGVLLDVNRLPMVEDDHQVVDDDDQNRGARASSSPPNSAASSFQMDFGIYSSKANEGDDQGVERGSSRASDEDENGSTRKKLRLSKDQSAFLEESFKEHNTLNPKQKLALAKQLNLRPRQVEVWFQNRRARTKLKQTELDCEYLKRCCETLTEENRRLHKELQELRALKSSNPFYMQLPATTLTMCPSCERVATTTTATTTNGNNNSDKSAKASLSRPRFYPFSHTEPKKPHPHQPSTAS